MLGFAAYVDMFDIVRLDALAPDHPCHWTIGIATSSLPLVCRGLPIFHFAKATAFEAGSEYFESICLKACSF